MPDNEREMIVQSAVDDFLGCFDDCLAYGFVEFAEAHIGFGGGALDDAKRPDNRGGLCFPADLEIAKRALSLSAPIAGGLHFDRAKGVGLGAGLGHSGVRPGVRWSCFLSR